MDYGLKQRERELQLGGKTWIADFYLFPQSLGISVMTVWIEEVKWMDLNFSMMILGKIWNKLNFISLSAQQQQQQTLRVLLKIFHILWICKNPLFNPKHDVTLSFTCLLAIYENCVNIY